MVVHSLAESCCAVGGVALANRIRRHVANLSTTRHASASRLGATPTGHFAAEKVNLDSVTANSATVRVAIPGISRAFHPVTINPVHASCLTIPVHAWAYGRRVAEVARRMKVFKPKGKDYLATLNADGTLTTLYLLRRSVTLQQDPTLLPTPEVMQATFRDGCAAALERVAK